MPVKFDEASHTYTSHKGSLYISVTTLIKKYTPPFDSHYWSTYKAMKAVLEKKGEWVNYKRNCGGWENVVAYVRMDKTFKHREEVKNKKREILEMWAREGKEAALRGTKFHKSKEESDRKSGYISHSGVSYPISSGDILSAKPLTDGLYPELLLYDDELEIAGQADWVLKVGNTIHIKDYKTSKDVDKTGFMEEMLLYPVNNLLNAKFFIYSLQMSLYALILERKGYEIGTLTIEHIDSKTHETIDVLPTEYHREEAKKLVEHYCETEKKKRKGSIGVLS